VRPAQDGAREMLEGVAELGLPTALICNTLSANGTRRLVRDHGFAGLLSVELYSDEQGLRKPNPAIFTLALRALDLAPEQVWYVGDKLDRDVLAARRAGLGAAILMTSNDTTERAATGLAPDVVLSDPRELLDLVRTHAPTSS
jgi:N-acetyl-D-muramate 6-phosphate phosphatase